MRRLCTCLGVTLLVFGCGSGSSERTSPEPSVDTPTAPEPPPEPPGPAPTVRIAVEVARGSTSLRIESRGAEPTDVGALALQRQDGDDWTDVPATLHLRDSCDAEPAECFTLTPGAVLLPPAWTGKVGPTSGQCACQDCDDAPAGTYRFVVRGCGNTEPAFGESFVRE
ncbi:MAG: hypothetical protein AB8I08_21530 [Sandaracinaceae bacterium]